MAGGSFKKNSATGKFIKLPDGKFARCTCCGDFALAEPCGEDYEGPNVYFSPGKAPECAHMYVGGEAGRCFKIRSDAEPYSPGSGDIYLDIGAPGNEDQHPDCCTCDESCPRISSITSHICPLEFDEFPGCCCVESGSTVSGSGETVRHIWYGSSDARREFIETYTWSWSFTEGVPGSYVGTWTRVIETLDRVSPGVYNWFTTTTGPTSFFPNEDICPPQIESVASNTDVTGYYFCGGAPGGVTQYYTEEWDCEGYEGTAGWQQGTLDNSCGSGTCGEKVDWQVTITVTQPGLPTKCTGGCG